MLTVRDALGISGLDATPGVTRPGRRLEGLDRWSVLGGAFTVKQQAAFFLGDELLEGREVLVAGFVTHIVVGDVDGGESVSDLAHMVSHPGESVGEVAKVRAKEDGEGIVVAAAIEDAFVAVGESGFELVDGFVGEGAETESASTSFLAKELLESEGALRGFDDAADLIVVDAEVLGGLGVGAVGSEGVDDLALKVWGQRRGVAGELRRKGSHLADLYSMMGAATSCRLFSRVVAGFLDFEREISDSS
jgi:hypothetical protein